MSTSLGDRLQSGFRILLHCLAVGARCVSLQRLWVYFLLREGGLGPCLSLCNDMCPWSLYAALVVDNGGTACFAGSDASRAVLAFPAVFPSLSAGPRIRLWLRFHRCSSWTRLW